MGVVDELGRRKRDDSAGDVGVTRTRPVGVGNRGVQCGVIASLRPPFQAQRQPGTETEPAAVGRLVALGEIEGSVVGGIEGVGERAEDPHLG
jgi:hypothetical protein